LAVLAVGSSAHGEDDLYNQAPVADESKPAHSEEASADIAGPGTYLGLQAGNGFVTSKGGGNFFTFGGRVGTGVYRDHSGILSLGLVMGTLNHDITVSSVNVKQNITVLMSELVTRRMWGTGLYMGGRIGAGLVSADVSAPGLSISGTGTSLVVGPALGYELPFGESPMSFGIDCSWLAASGGDLNFPVIGKTHYDSSSAVLLNFGLNFHW
jgi:hypothetical protein